jgi:hypothetical protein
MHDVRLMAVSATRDRAVAVRTTAADVSCEIAQEEVAGNPERASRWRSAARLLTCRIGEVAAVGRRRLPAWDPAISSASLFSITGH